MKILRHVLAIALAITLSGVAKADDFQMVIIDPLPKPSEITFIMSQNFTATLSACKADQLNGLDPNLFLGCFTGLNDTGAPLTSLEVVIPVFDVPGSSPPVLDTPSCTQVGGGKDIFPTCSVSSNLVDDFVYFSGGDLPTAPVANGDCDGDHDGNGNGLNADDVKCNQASIFTIAVGFGADCGTNKECKQDTAALIAAFDNPNDPAVGIADTPEPNSFLLMSTGVLSIGLFGAYRRRQMWPLTRKL